jgi:hypothetical protein
VAVYFTGRFHDNLHSTVASKKHTNLQFMLMRKLKLEAIIIHLVEEKQVHRHNINTRPQKAISYAH